MHSAFEKLYTSNKRYFLITGGRGSLKSSNVHEFIGDLCRMQKGHGVLLTRYTMTSAEKSIIPEFKIVAKRCGYLDEFEISNNTARHKVTGSFIYFSGIKTNSGDQTANLKSIAGITTWVIEEGEDFNDEKRFDVIDDSIRNINNQNRVIWIQNPSTKEHFIYERFIRDTPKTIRVKGFDVTISNHPDVEHIHTTYHIGLEYLDETWLGKADRYYQQTIGLSDHEKQTTHYYYNYIGGWLEKAEGVIITNWCEGIFDTSIPYCYGQDFGFVDPNAMVKVAVDSSLMLIYLRPLLYKSGQSDKQTRESIVARMDRAKDALVCDHKKGLIKDLVEQDGVNAMKALKGPGSVVAGLKKMMDYTVIVDKTAPCYPEIKIELNNYAWSDKKAEVPIDKFNHLIDASRYGFTWLVGGMQNEYNGQAQEYA